MMTARPEDDVPLLPPTLVNNITLAQYASVDDDLVTSCPAREYAVLLKTFGPYPRLVFVWSVEIAVNTSARAVQCLTVAEYLSAFLELCGSPEPPKKVVGICLLVLLAITTSYSVKVVGKDTGLLHCCQIGSSRCDHHRRTGQNRTRHGI
ncbi:b(0,+)-type amino acid transporter 1-like [Haliotis rubra]|uniref:b(0,+)-type amino acid transporter 1-like n=1 Tax=Haliotis rubra TaxID=36100 RepID=UPI001EE5BE71|nr:b(0,+)-type amino acid transporter 1-like [Haliotis rubra]